MIEPPPGHAPFQDSAIRALRAAGRSVVTVVVLFYSLLDALIFPLVRPVIGWLAGLDLFRAIGAAIGRLPPYAVLALLGLAFVVIEPLKALALWWMALGHALTGLALLGGAHLLSLFVVERIYHAGHAQLMRIGWFARLMGWLVGLRDRALAWVRSTSAWKTGRRLAMSLRLAVLELVRKRANGKR